MKLSPLTMRDQMRDHRLTALEGILLGELLSLLALLVGMELSGYLR
jgi:hypothetical protein